MASSSSYSSAPFTVTQEQFRTFHNIDRILFTKLVHNIGRNPTESMQVIALWIWLENSGQCRDLVNKMLTWPDTLISSLFDEAVVCLSCIESSDEPSFPFFSLQNIQVPLTQSITKSIVSLSFFRDSRLKILHGVTKIVNEVCARAFEDLVLDNVRGNDTMMQLSNLFSHHFHGFDPYDHGVQRQNNIVLRNEIDGMMLKGNEAITIPPPEERTIFLTFSKGYPISENEIRDYFVRKFGECFEGIHMQEVASMEQPLYARLIVYSASFMDVMLEGKNKAKFSINGKHVWARKYVRKLHRSPPQPSSPSQQASAQT